MFFLVAGPCVVESEEICFEIANHVKTLCDKIGIEYIFKASYRKANRTRIDSFTGIGDEKALQIIQKVGSHLNVKTTTDIHSPEEADLAANYVDILQIPAFLSRQTSLLTAAGNTGKVVNIKKGQFLSGESMKFAHEKVLAANPAAQVWLTERGNTFGYQDLVVDFRNIPTMKSIGCPVVMDCTHSLQQPNQSVGVTGGKPELISTIAKAAIATGADGLFIETHPRPEKALSDGANMLRLDHLEKLLLQLANLSKALQP